FVFLLVALVGGVGELGVVLILLGKQLLGLGEQFIELLLDAFLVFLVLLRVALVVRCIVGVLVVLLAGFLRLGTQFLQERLEVFEIAGRRLGVRLGDLVLERLQRLFQVVLQILAC